MASQKAIVCCAFFLINIIISIESVQVTTNQGILEGATLANKNGVFYDVFYGIPFAAPPVGSLRFVAPQHASNWDGVRNATTPGPMCFQNVAPNFNLGQEDCLYLNVYVPNNRPNDTLFPVMFWIHGGAFIYGTAVQYDPQYFMENDVIVVSTNYRLGIFGFLALTSPQVSGNAALKDVVLALQWVQENIQNFGGDSNDVTVFGESAGGVLSHYLLASPSAVGLYSKLSALSGVSTNEWASHQEQEILTSHLMSSLNISSNNTDDLIDALLEMSPETLVLVTSDSIVYWSPVVEGDYSENPIITENPRDLFESGNFNRVPTLTGFTSQEGLLFFIGLTDIQNISSIDQFIPDFSFYIPKNIQSSLSPEEEIIVIDKIRNFYFPNNDNLIEGYIDLSSDSQFIRDIDKYARVLSKYVTEDSYYYQFSYNGVLNFMKYRVEYNYTGAAHGDELAYLFDADPLMTQVEEEIIPTEQDLQIRSQIIKLWTNFAKYGKPIVDDSFNLEWNPVSEEEVNCLDINSELTIIKNPLEERMQFWRDLEDSYSKK